MNIKHKCIAIFLMTMTLVINANANICKQVKKFSSNPNNLLVIVPATSHGEEHWESFYKRFNGSPESKEYAWLFVDHKIDFTTTGDIRKISQAVGVCINQAVTSGKYQSITLIGHSIGGMLVRRAYLESSGVFSDYPKSSAEWTKRVNKILLFASVNRGIPEGAEWWSPMVNWVLRTFPHPRYVLEDLAYGSDFIADTRIAWIRYFAQLRESALSTGGSGVHVPEVVQFWGTDDSIVSEKDNADLKAFSGTVIERISGATHGNLIRLEEEFTDTPNDRWALFENKLFSPQSILPDVPAYSEDERVLIILNGIRDSSNSGWVTDIRNQAIEYYGKDNIEAPEYGYFTAAHFVFSPLRKKNIPKFRDLYTEILAKKPLAKFDFIGHSNGTYILANSLQSTPSMKFNNVVLVAPVLPENFNWTSVFSSDQISTLRYDVSNQDWPVGVLCQVLRAIGISDIGASGVLLFSGGNASMARSDFNKVGWHDGGHGAALESKNRKNLLNSAYFGKNDIRGLTLHNDVGVMRIISNSTFYIVWFLIVVMLCWLIKNRRNKILKKLGIIFGSMSILYILLDII